MIKERKLRRKVIELIKSLLLLDAQVLELCERLPLPSDAERMWNLQLPENYAANIHGALMAVREGCLAEALKVLQRSVGETDESLRMQYLGTRGAKEESRFLEESAVYPSDRETKPISERMHRHAEDS